MSVFPRALLLAAAASLAVASVGCADLTRPDEITIIAEPPPAPKVAPKPAAIANAPADAEGSSEGPRRPAKKAGG